jgi:hypothetical protein
MTTPADGLVGKGEHSSKGISLSTRLSFAQEIVRKGLEGNETASSMSSAL